MGAIVEIFLLTSALCGAVLWLAQHSIVIAVAASALGAALLTVLCHMRCRAARQAVSEAMHEQINEERDQWQGLLAQHVPVLPLMAGQLRGTADQVEQAVGQVCGSFDEIANRARQNVDATAALLAAYGDREGERQKELRQLMDRSRATMQASLSRIVEGSGRAMKAVYQLDDIQKSLQHFAGVLEAVERIARRARKMTELTAKGEEASGSGSWSQDLADLAEYTARAAAMTGVPLADIDAKLQLIHDELKLLASSDFAAILEDRGAMEKTIDALSGENEQLHFAARQTAVQERMLAHDISQAVRALQFGDAVRQRLDHVVQALVATEKAFYVRLSARRESQSTVDRDWAARLQKIYTMAEERQVLAAHLGESSADPLEASRIELF
jgi:methyl-accepting chemotaxis protein